MSWIQALVLGAIQGATEFLPISSSGHLALVPWVLGWNIDQQAFLPFAVIVHWGTLSAVVLTFRRELWSLLTATFRGLASLRPLGTAQARLAWLLALATVPAALAGALFQSQVEQAFSEPVAVALLLWVTAMLLLIGERLSGGSSRNLTGLRAVDAVLVGLAQALALFPGLSRSGATMAAGMSRGLSRLAAARFSFLLAVPIMLGAGAVSLTGLRGESAAQSFVGPLLIGFAASAFIGALTIRWLLSYLARGSLRAFAGYCAVAGAAVLALSLLRG